MTGGSESVAGEKDGGTTLIAQVPVGWRRKVEDGAVSYISPSGTVLQSVDEVRVYLRTDGTCKCGLECPLVPNKVFNFDPAAMVQAPGHQSGKVEEDMTKLCNHRRKVDAMTALCQSMHPSHLAPLAQATGGVVCSVDGRESRGSMLTHGDGAHCTYPQPRHSQPKPNMGFPLSSSRSVLQNGSVNLSPISRPPDQGSPLKKSQAPVYAKQQWSPHPPLIQNTPQRTAHNPTSPNNVKPTQAHPPDSINSFSFSSSLSNRTIPPMSQGASVKSPSPLSPSRTRDSFSPHQRSRHSSTSSLSDHQIFIQGAKPLHPTMPCSSPKLPNAPLSPCSRLEGILQHYKDCSTSSSISTSANQSIHQASLVALPNASDKRNGAMLGQILNQKQKSHINNSFPASSLLSAAAKAQLANQKTEGLSALPLAGLDKEQQSKGTLSSPALVSTSVSCGPLVSAGPEVCDPLAEQDKNSQTHHFLSPLLAPGVLGDLAALGNINSLHGLLGAGPLLLPQGVPLTQNQTTLNPLTCLQLTMAPALMGEKPVALHETPPPQDAAAPPHDSLSQQREAPGLFDPYGSFMDTIYTSFLQVSERGSDSNPLTFPALLQQASAPPSLSPRRACSVHNPDLSRLGPDVAQSPARGTPKPSGDSPPPPCRPAGAHALTVEEAKTHTSKHCVFSNGLRSEGGEEEEEEDEDEDAGVQEYLSPTQRTSRDEDEDISHAEQIRAEDVHTGSRRGRKRKQTLQMGSDLPGGIDSIIEEPSASAILVSRSSRSSRGKRRRVLR
ncbi:methyl-CpG-binding domain protein 6 isoform X2 [Danio rerio]|uniref:Methyl-CpG-binding domain protein 6 isoform X2 n=1 Tax=Danio rerio TaxID=7955 RepID=A0AC58JWM6_DANRE|nr:methyl-CpG-binding domain protein 6 isoform X2 [Danio rerio]|eukprot:XP_009301045.1 methyl-CpG-binding domain protein 6 isoform X2 [Danio rerio]